VKLAGVECVEFLLTHGRAGQGVDAIQIAQLDAVALDDRAHFAGAGIERRAIGGDGAGALVLGRLACGRLGGRPLGFSDGLDLGQGARAE
jgi:hypothetical protein